MSDRPTPETDAEIDASCDTNESEQKLARRLAMKCGELERQRDEARELARELRDALELYGLPYTDADLDTLAESTTGTGEINPTTAKREVIRRYAITKAKEVLP